MMDLNNVLWWAIGITAFALSIMVSEPIDNEEDRDDG